MISNFSGTLIPKSINPFNNPTEVSSSVTIAAVTPALWIRSATDSPAWYVNGTSYTNLGSNLIPALSKAALYPSKRKSTEATFFNAAVTNATFLCPFSINVSTASWVASLKSIFTDAISCSASIVPAKTIGVLERIISVRNSGVKWFPIYKIPSTCFDNNVFNTWISLWLFWSEFARIMLYLYIVAMSSIPRAKLAK